MLPGCLGSDSLVTGRGTIAAVRGSRNDETEGDGGGGGGAGV